MGDPGARRPASERRAAYAPVIFPARAYWQQDEPAFTPMPTGSPCGTQHAEAWAAGDTVLFCDSLNTGMSPMVWKCSQAMARC